MKTIESKIDKNEYKYYRSELLCKYMEISSAGKYSTLEQNQNKIKISDKRAAKINKRQIKKIKQINKQSNPKYI